MSHPIRGEFTVHAATVTDAVFEADYVMRRAAADRVWDYTLFGRPASRTMEGEILSWEWDVSWWIV